MSPLLYLLILVYLILSIGPIREANKYVFNLISSLHFAFIEQVDLQPKPEVGSVLLMPAL